MKRVVFDLILIACLHYVGIYMDIYWTPVSRPLHCDDVRSYYYTKQDNTVTPAAVLTGSEFVPMAIMIFTNVVFCGFGRWETYRDIVTFEIGGLLVFVSNNILKYYLGFHRPYFLTVCKSTVSMETDCRYGSNRLFYPECSGDENEHKWARLSFPSLHSSITAYGVLFVMVYLYRRREKVVQHYSYMYSVFMTTVNVFALTWIVFVAISRVQDRRHHVIDVVCGIAWGLVIATVTIVTMYSKQTYKDDSSCSISRDNLKANVKMD